VQEALATLPAVLPALFTFALTWSLGASCNTEGRTAFDAHVRAAICDLGDAVELPPGAAALPPRDADLYEWAYETAATGRRGWVRWMDTVAGDYKCDPDLRFSQIVVPTVDTVRGLGGRLSSGLCGEAYPSSGCCGTSNVCSGASFQAVVLKVTPVTLRPPSKVRYSYLLGTLLAGGHHVLVVGEAGGRGGNGMRRLISPNLSTVPAKP
jgi:hypothetical protein